MPEDTTDAFIVKDATEGIGFTRSFLASRDFVVRSLNDVGGLLGIPRSTRKPDLIDEIARNAGHPAVKAKILESLILRPNTWTTFRADSLNRISPPKLSDPLILVGEMGEDKKWYGPVNTNDDPGASWYICPVFIPHHYVANDNEIMKASIRWLVFARVWDRYVSLHWNGFTHADDANQATRNNVQFSYWSYVSKLFDEFEQISNLDLHEINLHKLVLETLWDKYRRHKNYEWTDRRVRAEASGVFLNARSGGGTLDIAIDDDDRGLRSLAGSIWDAVEQEFYMKYNDIKLPKDHEFKDLILGTIIRGLGAISYEFELGNRTSSNNSDMFFRAHFYFGMKPNTPSPDSLKHIRLYMSGLDTLNQLQFLYDHIGRIHVESKSK